MYAAALYLFVRANLGDPSDDLGAGPISSGASFPAEPTAGAVSPANGAHSSNTPGTDVVTDTLPDTTLTATQPAGIAVRGLTPHDLVIRVTSQHTIARLGYLVPTSLDHSSADMRDVAAPFTLRTTVYGRPAYAEVFVQTGSSGTPVTCTIAIDGKTTSTKTTAGVYGRQVCIG